MKVFSKILFCSMLHVIFGTKSANAITIEFNPAPRRLGQIEYVTINDLPSGWSSESLRSFLFIALEDPTPNCGQLPSRMTPRCARSFTNSIEFPSEFGDIRRLSYHALPEFKGKLYIAVALENVSRSSYQFSSIGEIDFEQLPDEPFVPRPTYFDGTNARVPRPNASTTGDICVDASRGNDTNTGACPNQPVRTIRKGLELFKNNFPTAAARAGRQLLIREGTYREGMDLTHLEGLPNSPIQVRGYPGERVILSQWTTEPQEYIRQHGSLPSTRDAWEREILGGYYGVNLDRAKYVTLENIQIEGARVEGVNPDNTTGVTVRFVNVIASGKWGIQAFGDINMLTIEGCSTSATAFTWSSEHGIYIAPLRSPGEPLARGIVLRSNTSVANERFGFQINGAARDVLIEGNVSIANKLGGFSVYGITGAVIRNNLAALNHLQPLVLYTYFDESYLHRGYGADPLGYGRQNATHFGQTRNRTAAYITVTHNTFVAGPVGPFVGAENPANMEVIKLNEGIGTDELGASLGEPFYSIEISNNILSGSNPMALSFSIGNQSEGSRGYRMLEGARVRNNLIYTRGNRSDAKLPWQTLNGIRSSIESLELEYPQNWSGNILGEDPRFVREIQPPQLSGVMDLRAQIPALLDGDYSLRPDSAARDQAVPVPYSNGSTRALNQDIRGIARSEGGVGDLGAYEYRSK